MFIHIDKILQQVDKKRKEQLKKLRQNDKKKERENDKKKEKEKWQKQKQYQNPIKVKVTDDNVTSTDESHKSKEDDSKMHNGLNINFFLHKVSQSK